MKIISLYSLLIMSTFCYITTSIQGMEKDNAIGEIDKLMIMHEASKKGIPQLEKEINDHMSATHLVPGFSIDNPFIIKYKDLKNDDSELSKKVFALIAQKTKFVTHNPSNFQSNRMSPKWNPIDECTCWRTMSNPNDVDLVSAFWNKAVLLAALKQLNP